MAAPASSASQDDENFGALLEMFTAYREPVIQRYLPEVRKGDKRIIWWTATRPAPSTAFPPTGEARSNMHVGGRPEPSELTRAKGTSAPPSGRN